MFEQQLRIWSWKWHQDLFLAITNSEAIINIFLMTCLREFEELTINQGDYSLEY